MWTADEASCQRFKARTTAFRLGSIASNLNTLGRYAEAGQGSTGVLIPQTLAYLSWATADVAAHDIDSLNELKDLLILWQSEWDQRHSSASWQVITATAAQAWSDRLLDLSGLLVSQ